MNVPTDLSEWIDLARRDDWDDFFGPGDIRLMLGEIARLRAALEEIAEGKGRFSNDPFKHACNTIEDMVGIAKAALPRSPQETAHD